MSTSLLSNLLKLQKVNTNPAKRDKPIPHELSVRIGPGLSSYPGRSWANILSNPGCEVMMLTSQTGTLTLSRPLGCHLTTLKENQEVLWPT